MPLRYVSRNRLAIWPNGVTRSLAALAVVDPQQAFLQVHVGHGEVAQFLVADAGGVKHFQDGPVAVAQNRGGVHALNDALGLLGRQHVPGQAARLAGILDALGRDRGPDSPRF